MYRRDFLKKSFFLFSGITFINRFNNFRDLKKVSGLIPTDEIELLKNLIEEFNKREFPDNFGDLLIEVAKSFVGVKYEASTLDIYEDKEELVIKVSGFDCVTFVENVLTFSRLIKNKRLDFDNFIKELQMIRYRDGIIGDYTSRLHYFSDWIYDNCQKEILIDLARELGSSEYDKKINYMTTHSSQYKQLKNNKKFIQQMRQIEDDINNRKKYYIKLNEIEDYYDKFSNGDIFALTTDIKGLDVTHTGFILISNVVKIVHASQRYNKVVISENGIKDYMLSVNKCTGLMLARPII